MLQPISERASDLRALTRSNVFLAAVIQRGSEASPVHIRNISVGGALVEGDTLPAAGSGIRLVRGRLHAPGEIAWHHGRYRGIKFHDPVTVAEWVKRPEHEQQRRVDQLLEAMRRGDVVPAGSSAPQLNSGKPSDELARIAERLSCLANLDGAAAEEILKLDVIAQQLRQSGH